MNNKYQIIDDFICNGKKMLIVAMTGATCVMTENEYIEILKTERKSSQFIKK